LDAIDTLVLPIDPREAFERSRQSMQSDPGVAGEGRRKHAAKEDPE
jgi:hypothetical protein